MNVGGQNWYGQYGDPSVIPPNSAIGRSTAGVVVNERSVASLAAVFSCIRILGDSVCQLTPHCFRRTPFGEIDKEVGLPPILTDPYADMSARDRTFRSVASLCLGGNIYRHVIDRDDQGNPTLVEILNPATMKVELIKGVKTYRQGAVGQFYPPTDLIHVLWASLPGGLVGMNPIEMGAMTFGLDIAAEEYGARYFAQGMSPGGILSVDKPLKPEDQTRLLRELQVNHGGLAQGHIPMVLDANVKWQQLSVNPETSQLLQSRQFSREEIAGFFGVPTVFLSDVSDRGGTYYKGLQELVMGFVMFGLKGYVDRIDEADSALLPPGFYVKRNVNELYRTNDEMLGALIMALRNTGVATANEIRPMVNLPPSDDPAADSLFAPLNSAPVDWYNPATGGVVATPPPQGGPSGGSGDFDQPQPVSQGDQ
jgi:HK97 family phage portal protein